MLQIKNEKANWRIFLSRSVAQATATVMFFAGEPNPLGLILSHNLSRRMRETQDSVRRVFTASNTQESGGIQRESKILLILY